jgi:hypothetical protein
LFNYLFWTSFYIFYKQEIEGWRPSDRGVSYEFGPDVLEAFLNKNDLSLMVRAHQCVQDGYEFFNKKSLVTLFSAPNYCDTFDNAGASLLVKEDLTCSFSIIKVLYKTFTKHYSIVLKYITNTAFTALFSFFTHTYFCFLAKDKQAYEKKNWFIFQGVEEDEFKPGIRAFVKILLSE